MDQKKKKILIIVAVIVCAAALLTWGIVEAVEKKQTEARLEAAMYKQVDNVAAAAEQMDLSCDYLSYNVVDTWDREIHVEIPGFSDLSPASLNLFYQNLRKSVVKNGGYMFDYEDDATGCIGNLIIIHDGEDEFSFNEYSMYKNGDGVADMRADAYNEDGTEKPKSSGSSKKKCSRCNGTGSVKYYYGGSTLEAIMDGHEDSWYGQCGSCGGTGYEK